MQCCLIVRHAKADGRSQYAISSAVSFLAKLDRSGMSEVLLCGFLQLRLQHFGFSHQAVVTGHL